MNGASAFGHGSRPPRYPCGMSNEPPHAVTCLKDAGASSVWMIERPGEGQRSLKIWPLTPLLALKLLFFQAQPQRQLRGSRRLARLDIKSPRPVGRWRLRRRVGRWEVAIEYPFVSGRSALQMLHDGRIDEQAARCFGRQVGRIVRTLGGAGYVHRDLKLNNLVIADAGGEPIVWVIDAVGVRPTMSRREAVVQMLDRLLVQTTDQPVARNRWAWAPLLREAVAGFARRERREVMRRVRKLNAAYKRVIAQSG